MTNEHRAAFAAVCFSHGVAPAISYAQGNAPLGHETEKHSAILRPRIWDFARTHIEAAIKIR